VDIANSFVMGRLSVAREIWFVAPARIRVQGAAAHGVGHVEDKGVLSVIASFLESRVVVHAER
jgi:hypothetical protein